MPGITQKSKVIVNWCILLLELELGYQCAHHSRKWWVWKSF